jgi:hypothetical protein
MGGTPSSQHGGFVRSAVEIGTFSSTAISAYGSRLSSCRAILIMTMESSAWKATTTRQSSPMCFEQSFGQGVSPLSEYPATRHPSIASRRRRVFTKLRAPAGTSLKSSIAPAVATSANLGGALRTRRFAGTIERVRQDCRGQWEPWFLDAVLQFDRRARVDLPDL